MSSKEARATSQKASYELPNQQDQERICFLIGPLLFHEEVNGRTRQTSTLNIYYEL